MGTFSRGFVRPLEPSAVSAWPPALLRPADRSTESAGDGRSLPWVAWCWLRPRRPGPTVRDAKKDRAPLTAGPAAGHQETVVRSRPADVHLHESPHSRDRRRAVSPTKLSPTRITGPAVRTRARSGYWSGRIRLTSPKTIPSPGTAVQGTQSLLIASGPIFGIAHDARIGYTGTPHTVGQKVKRISHPRAASIAARGNQSGCAEGVAVTAGTTYAESQVSMSRNTTPMTASDIRKSPAEFSEIRYAGGTFIIDAEICKALFAFVSQLAKHGRNDSVSLPSIVTDLRVETTLLLGPASQIWCSPVPGPFVEIGDDEIVDDLRARTLLLQPVEVLPADQAPSSFGIGVFDLDEDYRF
jgi:hypothetical protein